MFAIIALTTISTLSENKNSHEFSEPITGTYLSLQVPTSIINEVDRPQPIAKDKKIHEKICWACDIELQIILNTVPQSKQCNQ